MDDLGVALCQETSIYMPWQYVKTKENIDVA